ncbi:membrane skeletal protein, putative [Babesia ovis]|uniref:Membrane skeletal protein, putative n=1 Tax=Babesia ovis TaxID=5869 RepID=A0A9W5TEZ9_BABOV|nr:membrane skeletal protein, putative [Babesia ovis]
MVFFDCCSGGNVSVEPTNFDVDAHRRVLIDAGISADALQSIDVGHYQILEPVTQTKIVEVQKEIIDEKIIEVPEIQYVDKIVEVDVPVVKYKPVYKKKEVVVEKHRHVPRIVYEDKIVEVPQIQYVEKEVEVPQIVVKEKIVEEPKIMIVEHVIPVLRVKKADHATDIDNAGQELLDEKLNGVTYVEAEGGEFAIQLAQHAVVDARADMACCTTR